MVGPPYSPMSQPPTAAPASVTWLGHATALLSIDGVSLLTDPVLGSRIGPLVRIAPPVKTEMLGRLDCVLLSHLHADHTHLWSLREAAASVPILAPHGAADWLADRGIRAVTDLRPGEDVDVAGVRVSATPAVHDPRRRPFGPRAQTIGYLVSGTSSAYFAGDTDLFDGMSDLRGLVDLALLPVWGWGPTLGPGHLDPERAARAAALIAPRIAVPIHWGTFAPAWRRRPQSDPQQPAREFERLAGRYAPGVEVRILQPGERMEFG